MNLLNDDETQEIIKIVRAELFGRRALVGVECEACEGKRKGKGRASALVAGSGRAALGIAPRVAGRAGLAKHSAWWRLRGSTRDE